MLEAAPIAAIRLTLSATPVSALPSLSGQSANCPRSAPYAAISGLRPNLAVLSAKASAHGHLTTASTRRLAVILAADAVSTAAS